MYKDQSSKFFSIEAIGKSMKKRKTSTERKLIPKGF